MNQRDQNAGLVGFLKEHAKHPDWQVVAAFYAALHHFEAARKARSLQLEGDRNDPIHVRRIRTVERHWPTVAVLYETLYDASRRARYHCWTPNTTDVKDAEDRLVKIKTTVRVGF